MKSTPKTRNLPSRALLALATGLLVVSATIVVPMTSSQAAPPALTQNTQDLEPTVYNQPGEHHVNGRHWKTSCEMYSSTVVRCSTDIWATTVKWQNGKYANINGWVFNNLTYLPSGESQWRGNPLAMNGKWTAKDGRQWKTECNTAQTGHGGCRSYAWATSVSQKSGKFVKENGWTFNNIVQFTTANVPPQTTIPPEAPNTGAKPTVAPTASAKPTVAPTTTAVPTASAAPTTPVAGASGLMGWELTKDNIGLAPFGLKCDTLPRYTGSLQPAAGTRITGKLIIGNLDLRHGDIIVERSCIRTGTDPSSWAMISNYVCDAEGCPVTATKGVIIRDSEIDASKAQASQIAATCAFRGTATLQRNYMHGMGSGICFYGTGAKLDAIADQNFVTNLRSHGESHNEAATIRDFILDENPNRVARFSRNRLEIEEGNISAVLFIQPTWDNIDTLLVEGNLIAGGGWALYIEQANGTYSNARSINNRFRSTGWGPSTVQRGPGWAQWDNNYTYDPAKPSAAGNVVRPG